MRYNIKKGTTNENTSKSLYKTSEDFKKEYEEIQKLKRNRF